MNFFYYILELIKNKYYSFLSLSINMMEKVVFFFKITYNLFLIIYIYIIDLLKKIKVLFLSKKISIFLMYIVNLIILFTIPHTKISLCINSYSHEMWSTTGIVLVYFLMHICLFFYYLTNGTNDVRTIKFLHNILIVFNIFFSILTLIFFFNILEFSFVSNLYGGSTTKSHFDSCYFDLNINWEWKFTDSYINNVAAISLNLPFFEFSISFTRSLLKEEKIEFIKLCLDTLNETSNVSENILLSSHEIDHLTGLNTLDDIAYHLTQYFNERLDVILDLLAEEKRISELSWTDWSIENIKYYIRESIDFCKHIKEDMSKMSREYSKLRASVLYGRGRS